MLPGPGLDVYREVWLADFEFSAPPGERPTPVCLVAREFWSGRTIRVWQDDLLDSPSPPYPTGPQVLYVAYYASAELGCHLALDWPMPERVLDLFAEFRCLTNGLNPHCGNRLLGALAWFGLNAMDGAEKERMRELAIRGGPWTAHERESLLAYCEADVRALAALLSAMLPTIDLPRSVLRGRYMRSVAQMEWAGVPLDVEMLSRLRDSWESIQDQLIQSIDTRFGVFDGRTFVAERWAGWLARSRVPWPRRPSGALMLDDDTFREVARSNPDIALMRELRHSLSQLRLEDLAVGADGRNRTLLSPFGARTGRNTPSNSRFILGPSTWLRGLIKPVPGMALAYVDWSQQEFGIAAALSGDAAMMEAYRSGDPYLEFARQSGRIPADGTKDAYGAERELCKACILGTQYGMGPESLARRIGKPTAYGRELLRLHRETYPAFWRWSDGAESHAMLLGRLHTVFGWTVRVGPNANPRSLRNFPCQANGAELLRLACCLASERGVSIVAPVHDAVLIEAAEWEIDDAVTEFQVAMAQASAVILDGFRLRSDAKIIRWPDRYMDDRGREFWVRVMTLLLEAEPVRKPSQSLVRIAPDPCDSVTPTRAGLSGDPCESVLPA
jgi:hypothetical protein